jgi:hypothetical protein
MAMVAKSKNAFVRGVFFACGLAASPSFADEALIDGLEDVKIPELRTSIASYYKAESQKDWQETYEARPSGYAESVPFHLYEKKMNESADGWSLQHVEVIGYAPKYDKSLGETVILVGLNFRDRMNKKPRNVRFQIMWDRSRDKTFTMEEKTLWIFESNRWKCVDCGQRHHMPLSGRMLY